MSPTDARSATRRRSPTPRSCRRSPTGSSDARDGCRRCPEIELLGDRGERSAGTVVVGGGIVGASIAYHLAARGQRVVLVEKGMPAGEATGASFGWIGRPVTSDSPSAALRRRALDDYRRLARELPDVRISWSGSLTWDELAVEDGTPWISDVTPVEPNLLERPTLAQHRHEDGALDPVETTEALLAGARRLGADVRLGETVTDVILEGRRAVGVRTLQEPHVGDRVVLAAGVGTAVLCERLGIPIPVRSDPAVMFRFDASPGVIRSIVGGDGYEVRQLADGSLLCPAVYADEATRGALDERGRALALRLERTFRGLGPVALRSAEVGWRPMPVAGEPLIGFSSSVDGLYLAVMHSAVTLAASVGLLVAGEIATGEVPAELASLRPPV